MRGAKGRWALLTALFLCCFPPSFAEEKAKECAACHGADGNSLIRGTPSIAGQPQLFLENQLILFREGLRRSLVMEPLVKGMKDAEIVALAKHYASLPARNVNESAFDQSRADKGRSLAKSMHCGQCHVSDFSGQNQIPRLAGQREEYLAAEMRAYRNGERTGGDTIMSAVLFGVKDPDIEALAHFLAHAPVKRAAGKR